MANNNDFQDIYEKLHNILIPYAQELTSETDDIDKIYINTSFVMPNKKVMFFGAAQIGKNYVSFHLMPIYVFPELLDNISLDLKNRMQGKSCFNFKTTNNKLFTELTKLTKAGFDKYEKAGYV